MERNLEYEKEIRLIVESHSNGTWPRIILARKNKHLLNYIIQRTPLLNDLTYTLATKIYWVLNDIHSFPLCQNEKCHKPLVGKNVGALDGYIHPFCDMSCSQQSSKVNDKKKKTCFERYGNPNYRNRMKAKQTYIKHYGVDNNMKSDKGKSEYKAAIQEKYGKDWMTQTKRFQDKAKETWMEKYGVNNPTKSKEVVDGIQERFLKKHGVKNPMQIEENKDKIKKTCLEKYGVAYGFQFEPIKEKSHQTCLERYGTKYPTQNIEVKEKLKKSLKAWHANNTRPFKILYKYDGRKFDSSWELYYYIWLKDNDIDFEFQPKTALSFLFNGEVHFYHPDFLVKGHLVEIKGDQFFKKDGTMCCPWRYSKWSDADKEIVDSLYEAKHQCMKNNGVRILKGVDLEEAFRYIESRYGYNFIDKFKIKK